SASRCCPTGSWSTATTASTSSTRSIVVAPPRPHPGKTGPPGGRVPSAHRAGPWGTVGGEVLTPAGNRGTSPALSPPRRHPAVRPLRHALPEHLARDGRLVVRLAAVLRAGDGRPARRVRACAAVDPRGRAVLSRVHRARVGRLAGDDDGGAG